MARNDENRTNRQGWAVLVGLVIAFSCFIFTISSGAVVVVGAFGAWGLVAYVLALTIATWQYLKMWK